MALQLRVIRNNRRLFGAPQQHFLPRRRRLSFNLIFLFFCGESSFKPALRAGHVFLYCTREITHWCRSGAAGTRPVERAGYGVRTMEKLLLEYLPILIFIGLAAILGSVLVVVPLLIAPSKPDPEKLSAYECGFPAFGDARMKFDVRFYLVAILFIIFDLEVAFLFPWAVTLGGIAGSDAGIFAFWSMMAFLGVLTVGFIYEWKKGALEWE
jgi:NADH-quinone oxidoreductase subunit A